MEQTRTSRVASAKPDMSSEPSRPSGDLQPSHSSTKSGYLTPTSSQSCYMARKLAHNKDQQKQITNDRQPVPAQHPEHQVARNHLKQRTLGKGQNKAQLKKASRRGNGGGLATRCANLHQTLPDRHWTGIPKEREKLVGPGRLGEEARTLK